MIRKLLIRDLTLRDGQQSAFATRMSQAQIDRVLPYYKDAGFYAMEVWGGAVPDSVMRYLGENPWDRLEIIKEKIGNSSKLSALMVKDAREAVFHAPVAVFRPLDVEALLLHRPVEAVVFRQDVSYFVYHFKTLLIPRPPISQRP